MLSSQDIAKSIRFALDAENSDHYGDQEDIIPAINMAVKWCVLLAVSSYGIRKSVDEALSDLARADVFRTSSSGRIHIDEFPKQVLGILSVNPLPQTEATGEDPPIMDDDKRSYLRPDLYHVDSEFSAYRSTKEAWEIADKNPFAAGYSGASLCDSLKTYKYLSPVKYNPGLDPYVSGEISIKPIVSKGLCTVFWAEDPTNIQVIGVNDIPLSPLFNTFVFNAALKYISYKQGDRTNLYMVTKEDVNQLLQAL